MARSIAFTQSTGLLQLIGLVDNLGAFQNDATVTLESIVEKFTGDAISDVTVPQTMAYISGSNGDYQVSIGPLAGWEKGKVYVATVKAVGSQGYEKVFKEEISAMDKSA